jgi:hypothetical protein
MTKILEVLPLRRVVVATAVNSLGKGTEWRLTRAF